MFAFNFSQETKNKHDKPKSCHVYHINPLRTCNTGERSCSSCSYFVS